MSKLIPLTQGKFAIVDDDTEKQDAYAAYLAAQKVHHGEFSRV